MAKENKYQALTLGSFALAGILPGLTMAGPYPALPPSLSTSVAPNVMLVIDTSASMLQDSNNAWLYNNLCNNVSSNWNSCINNNTNGFRTTNDSETLTPNSKMNIAKRVSRNLIDGNSQLRWGVFSFHDKTTTIGGDERGQGGLLRAAVQDGWVDSNRDALKSAITALNGRTATPLGETLLEVTRYFRGESSLYDKPTGNADKKYTRPIQYRCQKNFAIVITDGDATNDDDLPGNNGKALMSYVSYKADGSLQSKEFGICTAASTDCPNVLEGTSGLTVPGFGDKNNRPRAIRDVAKYAFEADMVTGATLDLDGKSFDDAKFKLQNLSIYTVGFATQNNVLPAAAAVGGGSYFTANNENELANSLKQTVAQIASASSNAGGVSVVNDSVGEGNQVYQPVFNPDGWYGELRCKATDANGKIIGDCPNPQAIIPVHNARKIYTSNGSSTAITFNSAADLADWQKKALAPPDGDVATVNKVIGFIRGRTDITEFRTRNSLLGDIVGGQPTVVGKPSGYTNDKNYSQFKQDKAGRKLVFIGANDGMMHAFDGDSMQELMAYVPAAVYPNLSSLTKKDYGKSAGSPHNWFVNGNSRQTDVRIGGNWKTLLVSGLAQGGRGYFALDATDAKALDTAATVRWELNSRNEADMGHTFGLPLIYNVRNGTDINNKAQAIPVVILANGYKNSDSTSSDTSALYIVNADNGDVLKKIVVPGKGGLSAPAGIDYGQDGVLDYVYAGDMNGKVWRFDLTSASPSGFKVESTPLFDAGSSQPIVMRPAVLAVNSKTDGKPVGNLVLFGTGKLQEETDRGDISIQRFYAVLDKMDASPVTASLDSLQQQRVTATVSIPSGQTGAGTFRQLSDSTLDLTDPGNTKRGWYLDLPEPSERLMSSPLLLKDKLLFATGSPLASEKCLPGGKGWVMGVNPLTGSVTKNRTGNTGKPYSFIDLDGDKRSSAGDMVNFSTGKSYVSGFALAGLPTELTYVQKGSFALSSPASAGTELGDAGNAVALKEANAMAVYTGHAKLGTSAGNAMGRPVAGGDGQLFVPQVGNDTLDQHGINKGSLGVRVETTLWWEVL
ncbi:PilC/PilY family type IV pilus protein [Craterilacuibacter sp. RT1T]|uniref:pilus assembly protein n=1 Tax=Craterilacuibacter sp. RT1T TaxID=2942211 RepID=UPI0020BF8223|nr:PilC/PilY family type IV pilus protein [Craterilacuibacter sp. RT1T]